MKLREFLIKKMTSFSERTAFENSGIKYSDLLRFLTGGLNDGKLELCDGKTKEEQALNIIKCIGRGKKGVIFHTLVVNYVVVIADLFKYGNFGFFSVQ